MIADQRSSALSTYSPERYANLLRNLEERCGAAVEFRVAETPVFLPRALRDRMANLGVEVTRELINDAPYIERARASIPAALRFAGETNRPHFLAAEFGFVREADGSVAPRMVEIEGFPALFGFQEILACAYRSAYGLSEDLESYLSGLDSAAYWNMFCLAVLGREDPENVVLLDFEPDRQKARPDYLIIARKLGIAVVDITTLILEGGNLYYTNRKGRQVPIRRIYNRARVDRILSQGVRLPVDFTRPMEVEWAGHPVWSYLIGRFSLPHLSRSRFRSVTPAAVFLDEFLSGEGRSVLEEAGARLPSGGAGGVYDDLVLKALFPSAGRGVQVAPTHEQLLAIPPERRRQYVLQQRIQIVRTVETPSGMAEARVRILYVWPHSGILTPVIPMAELGRAGVAGAEPEWRFSGASAVFSPR